MRGWRGVVAGLVAAGTAGGCELAEVTVAETEPVLVVDALIQVYDDAGTRVIVLLHRTVGSEVVEVPGATVELHREGGEVVEVLERPSDDLCVSTGPDGEGGTCYELARADLRFGDEEPVRLEVRTVEGERVSAVTRVPGRFSMRRPALPLQPGVPGCVLPPDSVLPMAWSRAAGAWAYIAEAEISGIRAALAERGIEAEEDPLYLLGLSVAASDTTIALPSQFGLFDRFDLDRDVAVELQGGLPAPTSTMVTVAAVDRNYVNWVRGGNFNPSGTVRVPSVDGDGTGFFGSARVRTVRVVVPLPGTATELPEC